MTRPVTSAHLQVLSLSYHASRLWAIPVTLVLAIIAGGFLIPVFNRIRLPRLRKKAGMAESGTGQPPNPDATPAPKPQNRLATAQQRAANSALALFLGKDGRLSTSTTIAAAWTAVIAWILVTLLFAWPPSWTKAFTNFNATYFALLGGPYAAWVLARTAVSTRVSNQTLQKADGDGIPRLSDLVSGDDGNPDLFDVQYVMFNLIAMAFVAEAFTRATAAGFPLIPAAMVLLTAGPAAVYAANKALATNKPLVSSVSPGVVAAGQTFTVFGQNLLGGLGAAGQPSGSGNSGTAGNAGASGNSSATNNQPPQVFVDGVPAQPVTTSAAAVTATAPALDYSNSGPVPVSVITPAGVQSWLQGALTVHRPPTLTGLDRTTAQVTNTVHIEGAWYNPHNAPLSVTITNTTTGEALAVAAQVISPNQTAQFAVPDLGGTGNIAVNVKLSQYGQSSDPVNLIVAPRPVAGQR